MGRGDPNTKLREELSDLIKENAIFSDKPYHNFNLRKHVYILALTGDGR
jgi:hypothetical protein